MNSVRFYGLSKRIVEVWDLLNGDTSRGVVDGSAETLFNEGSGIMKRVWYLATWTLSMKRQVRNAFEEGVFMPFVHVFRNKRFVCKCWTPSREVFLII